LSFLPDFPLSAEGFPGSFLRHQDPTMAVALRNAAALKPEIRLAQALSEYEAILTNDQKTKFRIYHGQQPPDVTDVMRLTAEIDRENKSRRCVGPRLTNVLQSVQQFSTIIDVIVGGSQSLLASGIWGAVKMTLQVTSNIFSYFENLSTLFMNIGRTCPRYQDFGFLYPKSTRLQKALCEYFTTMIELCQHAILFIRKPFVSQLSSILKSFQSEFGHFEIDLERLATTIREEISLVSKQEQSLEIKKNSAFRAFTLKSSDKVSQELQEIRKLRSRKAQSQFLDACSTYNHQTAWKQARKAGTTNWIYDTEEYKQWTKDPTSSTLWCTGILGSGKTVLSANVVENLMITIPATVSYFFCKHDEAESLQARTVIGSIARQLLSSVKPEIFDSVDLRHTSFLDKYQILEYLQKLLPYNQQEYFVIIDGLDECNEIEFGLLIQSLKEFLAAKHTFHIYCSSRPDIYQWASTCFSPRHNVLMSEARSEISQYIGNELEQRLELGSLCLGDPTTILTIQDALVKGSQGMSVFANFHTSTHYLLTVARFLWVAFQLDSICSEVTDEDIINSLQLLPKDLPETFNRILQKLETTKAANPGLCKRIFELVAAAQRPLTLEELRDTISVVPGETARNTKRLVNDMRKMLNCCGSLLVVDEEDSTVHFAHHSVKQHLLSSSMNPYVEQYHMRLSEANLNLGEICVTYLNFEVFNMQLTKLETIRQSPIIDVPSAVLSQNLPRSRVISNLAQRLLKGGETAKYDVFSQLQKAAGQATESSKQIKQEYPFLPYAQEYWLFHSKRFEPTRQLSYRLLRLLVSGNVNTVRLPWKGMDGADVDTPKRTGLHWAAGNGHEAVVGLLLERADVEADSRNKNGQTPLSCAAERGHEAVVKLLVERADVEADSKDRFNRTPMSYAAAYGHEAVVRLLVERPDVEADSKDNLFGRTPLSYAAENGHEAVVRLLVERPDVEMDSRDKDFGRTPLSYATESGHEAVVMLLQPLQRYSSDTEWLSDSQ
jgi:ankyrin repeat domain-containing protein 50